jgi:predicted O-methyltransferase YrrM
MTFLPQRFHIVYSAPVLLTMHERVALYGLVAGLQPARILEIGTFKGGSTLIMCAALDDLDRGRIVCVDPEPRIAQEDWDAVSHRASLVAAASPEALERAAELAGVGFDFAFIDGDHTRAGVARDIEATLPTLADEAHLLFHDANFSEVRDGIDDCIASEGGRLSDAGLISVERAPDPETGDMVWAGLRLLRFHRER